MLINFNEIQERTIPGMNGGTVLERRIKHHE